MKLYKKRIISRGDGLAYMIRYTLFTCPWFSIKLHRFLLSDPACLHDHPWAFLTVMLRGGYVEYTPTGSKVYGPGSILYRPANYTHRLEIHQPAWTFVITFKKTKEWGFFTPRGWVEWFRYTPSNTCE